MPICKANESKKERLRYNLVDMRTHAKGPPPWLARVLGDFIFHETEVSIVVPFHIIQVRHVLGREIRLIILIIILVLALVFLEVLQQLAQEGLLLLLSLLGWHVTRARYHLCQ